MATKAQLLKKADGLELDLAAIAGTGQNGKVLNRDLESAIGDHHHRLILEEYTDETDQIYKHLQMRRMIEPMKAFRYDKMKPDYQDEVMESEDWIAEEKINGWRMMLTYIPYSGFRAWGGNIGVNCLPTDYTDHLYIGRKQLGDFAFDFDRCFLLDCEVTVDDMGLMSGNPLEDLAHVLGGSAEHAQEYRQKGVQLNLHVFDYVEDDLDTVLNHRKASMLRVYAKIAASNVHVVNHTVAGKQNLLNTIWRKGGEGVILKNLYATYDAGGRNRTIAIKVKRTMSGTVGDDIDAFISGYTLTKEWSASGLIGSIELSVYLDGEPHVIANVSGMPDRMRRTLTFEESAIIVLEPHYLNKVLCVDGQELTNKNRRLQHAVVDWDRGFREDKHHSECILDLEYLEETKF